MLSAHDPRPHWCMGQRKEPPAAAGMDDAEPSPAEPSYQFFDVRRRRVGIAPVACTQGEVEEHWVWGMEEKDG